MICSVVYNWLGTITKLQCDARSPSSPTAMWSPEKETSGSQSGDQGREGGREGGVITPGAHP